MSISQSENWNTPVGKAARWVVVFVAGLGILWVVEFLLNLIIGWGLDWRLDGWGAFLLFIGSGILVLIAMILAGKIAATVTASIAPLPRKGLLILGAVYVVAQAVRLYGLFGDEESVWQFVLMKIEFVIVVSIVFTLAYWVEDADPGADLQPEGDAAA